MDHAKMQTVQSGIGLNELSLEPNASPAPAASFITSRAARVMLAGIGFLADAAEYPEFVENNTIHYYEGLVASAALVGSITGQLVAGSLADIIGRKKIFVATALFISVGSICSSLCYNSPSMNIYYQISFWRFFLGVGVGGEYPLAATVTSESSSPARRGALMAAVFSMQGVGAILSVLIVISCLKAGASNDFTWRFALGFGAVPAMLAFPYRLRMHETESFDRVKKERAAAAAASSAATNNSHNSGEGSGNRDRSDTWGSNIDLGSPSEDETTNYGAVEMSSKHIVNSGGVGYAKLGSESTHGSSAVSTKNPLRGAHSRSGIDISELDNTVHSSAGLTSMNHHHSTADLAAATTTHSQQLGNAFTYYKWHMFGTAMCWFLLDVDFYANNLFNHDITQSILMRHTADGSAAPVTPLVGACNSAILYLFAIPGYVLSIRYIDSVGRRQIQMMGFGMMALLFLVCTLSYDSLLLAPSDAPFASGRKYIYLLLYALTFLFSNFGPNTTSFVIPGEIYPSEVRATCHGISAAAGKLGAATGAYFFPSLSVPSGATDPTPAGIKLVMAICSAVALAGLLVTLLCIPSYQPRDLVYEGKYHPLPCRCLRPSESQLALLGDRYYEEPADGERREEEEQEEMVQIVERCDNYELTTTDMEEQVVGGGGGGGVAVSTEVNSRSLSRPITSYHQMSSSGGAVV